MKKYITQIFILSSLLLTFFIYYFENEVNKLDQEIVEKIELIKKANNDIIVLEAEWSYQNNPNRLSKLVRNTNKSQFSMLTPGINEFTKISNIENHKTMLSYREQNTVNNIR